VALNKSTELSFVGATGPRTATWNF